MTTLFDSLPANIFVAIVTLCIFLYWIGTRNFDYWEKRNVPFCKPTPFLGNFKDRVFVRKSLCEIVNDHYKELEGHKVGGLWLVKEPTLMIREPDIIKRILVKDFSHFQDRGITIDQERNPLTAHLVNLSGSKWRALRTKLTPTFTSGKMKMMYYLMNECAHEFVQFISETIRASGEFECKEAFAKFTTDIIGTCAFGLQFNSMRDPDSEFRRMGRRIFEATLLTTLRINILQLAPAVGKILNVRFPAADISDFFINAVNNTIEYREKNNVKRNDFLHLLIELKNNGKVEDDHDDSKIHAKDIPREISDFQDMNLTNTLLAAQAFVFFIAGFETSSATMSFALHELTVNPEVQEKARQEIDRVLEEVGGELTYEALKKMEYLDKIIYETLRKYPPAPLLFRVCNKTYREPDTGIVIEEGTRIEIPVYALHHDPKHFPDPEKFDPNRFSEEEKKKRHHYAFLPFGEGPRICIGMRFGLLQSKLGLATLLSRFELRRSLHTSQPLALSARGGIITTSAGGIWVRAAPRARAG